MQIVYSQGKLIGQTYAIWTCKVNEQKVYEMTCKVNG